MRNSNNLGRWTGRTGCGLITHRITVRTAVPRIKPVYVNIGAALGPGDSRGSAGSP